MLKVALAALCVASPLLAQDVRLPAIALGDRYLEANAGFSWYSPRGGAWGTITGRRVYLTGIRYERVIDAVGGFAWAYAAEWVPIAVVERTNSDETFLCYDSTVGRVCERDRSSRIAVGTGLSPIGFKAYFNRTGNRRVFASGSVGGLAFSSDVPVENSRRLNYTFEYGGGVEIARADGRAVTLGYKFHHISNGSSGQVNPGLDANVLYVGLRRRR
jgi:opacity protein-like surface antigen